MGMPLGTRIVVLGGSPVEVMLDVAASDEGGTYFSEADRLRLVQMTRGTATF